MEYVAAPKCDLSQCANPFLELPKGSDDRAALIVWRSRHCYLVLNRFPYNPGHLLAVPYREVASLAALTHEERDDLMEALVTAEDLLRKAFAPDGFNTGFNFGKAAGAGIPHHLHAHIVPRWEGDTNFMPVLAQTRVLPQALESTWERLMEVQAK